ELELSRAVLRIDNVAHDPRRGNVPPPGAGLRLSGDILAAAPRADRAAENHREYRWKSRASHLRKYLSRNDSSFSQESSLARACPSGVPPIMFGRFVTGWRRTSRTSEVGTKGRVIWWPACSYEERAAGCCKPCSSPRATSRSAKMRQGL